VRFAIALRAPPLYVSATRPSLKPLIVIPESRCDIRDPVPLHINTLPARHWIPAFAGMTKGGLVRPEHTPPFFVEKIK
jgi:hypothetical protein